MATDDRLTTVSGKVSAILFTTNSNGATPGFDVTLDEPPVNDEQPWHQVFNHLTLDGKPIALADFVAYAASHPLFAVITFDRDYGAESGGAFTTITESK